MQELEARAWENSEYLPEYFERLIVKSIKEDLNEMGAVFDHLTEICGKWEHKGSLFVGMKQFVLSFKNYFMGNFVDAEHYASISYEIFKKVGKTDYAGMALMIQGGALRSLGKMDKAVKLLYLGAEMTHPKHDMAVYNTYSYYHLAEIFSFTQDFNSAKEAYSKALEFALSHNNINGVFRTYNGLGNLYINNGDLQKGKEYYDKSLNSKKMSFPHIARAYCDLGSFHIKTKEYDLAEDYLLKSLKIRTDNNMEDASSTCMIELGDLYLKTGLLEKSINQLETALEITRRKKSKAKQMKCLKILAQAYKKTGQLEKSLDAFEEYDQIQQDFHSVTLKNIYAIKNQKIEDQKEVISEALNDIRASINYARRIQQAILPPSELISRYLPNSFILYQPKDIVAGDFYWFEVVDELILFAVADCTGHGVPGALVSVVCHNALNRAVREFQLRKPQEILDKVNELVQDTLSNTEESTVSDGMDLALCTLEPQTRTITFCGANNPLYIISAANNEYLKSMCHPKYIINEKEGKALFELKGNKQPIGKFARRKPFVQTEIELQPNDQLILSSDGYADQFGGEHGNKLMYKPFKQLLLTNSGLDLQTQKKHLTDFIFQWMGAQEQTDDICVMGVIV